ncbi:MAG TPA: hypothetical protein VFT56_10110 [Sphingomonas sp.]|nr:hypothetical protein [Sphingomonas sp.]
MLNMETSLKMCIAGAVLGFSSIIATPGWTASTNEAGASLPRALTACDRHCLVSIANAYFAAILAHKPENLPLDPAVRMTENTEAIPIGQGILWRGLSEPLGKYRVDVR